MIYGEAITGGIFKVTIIVCLEEFRSARGLLRSNACERKKERNRMCRKSLPTDADL